MLLYSGHSSWIQAIQVGFRPLVLLGLDLCWWAQAIGFK